MVRASPQHLVPGSGILPGLSLVDGVVKREDGLILIHDLERLLSLDDEAALTRALQAAAAGASGLSAGRAAPGGGGAA